MTANATIRPFVTVVMPIRNEERAIAESLGAVLGQSWPPERMEVLVVDGDSTDRTREVVRETAAGDPRVTLLANPGRIVPTGLNLALGRARGEIVVRVDGHCRIAPDFLERSVHRLLATAADAVGGPIETVGETPEAEAIARAMGSRFGVGGSAFRLASSAAGGAVRVVDTVAFGAYRREALERAGLFDEELVRNQDDEYNYRLRSLGGRILLDPAIRSRYTSRGTVTKLFSQYFQYGLYKVRVLQKHPRQMQPRQAVPPLFVATLGASLAAAPFSPLARKAAAVLAATWGLAATGEAVRLGRDAAERGRIVAAFGALHLGYGAGVLAGLVRFAGRWGDRRGRMPERAPIAAPATPTDRT